MIIRSRQQVVFGWPIISGEPVKNQAYGTTAPPQSQLHVILEKFMP
jgi:hypothetical protein